MCLCLVLRWLRLAIIISCCCSIAGLCSLLLKVICDYLFDLSNLPLLLSWALQDRSSWDNLDSTPGWQNFGNAHNEPFHLTRVNEWAMKAILNLFNDICEQMNFWALFHDQLPQDLSDTQMLLKLPLFFLLFQCCRVSAPRFIFQPLLGLNHVECLLRNAMLRKTVKVLLAVCALWHQITIHPFTLVHLAWSLV